jgi:hypothetical protein
VYVHTEVIKNKKGKKINKIDLHWGENEGEGERKKRIS